MEPNLQDVFAMLKEKLGSHTSAAKALGINPDHYCALRNGRANVPARTAAYIILKASELDGGAEVTFSSSPSPTTTLTQPTLPGC